ncbi:hypothetical protein ERO13_A12G187700v2 [Gossypium hirsutum]|nr:protein NOI4-like [Gossypium arboreum]KAG4171097.1 hypothetical protein ERO13_A12G187700v2 [Gossypium hirsutum]TYG90846.1 hypothetical protein ES288_A12G215300v1 [Gossypium darwinii]TYH97036.1 hypothetical protein ES332_A12G215700v1 [Gossypium tomentosum]TYH97037.1 hypothetical protein ES332_A12G215700v1 [Gossypium tomentosum]
MFLSIFFPLFPSSLEIPSLIILLESYNLSFMAEKGKALPKFGEWDLKDPATADGFTLIFNRARNEKKTRATAPPPPSIVPQKVDTINKPPPSPPKTKCFCFVRV